MSAAGHSFKAAATDGRVLRPLAVLGLILFFDLIFIPGFFDMEIRQGHLFGSLVDILRNSAPVFGVLAFPAMRDTQPLFAP